MLKEMLIGCSVKTSLHCSLGFASCFCSHLLGDEVPEPFALPLEGSSHFLHLCASRLSQACFLKNASTAVIYQAAKPTN